MTITAVLIHKNNLYTNLINEGEEITYGTHKKDTIKVPDFNEHQVKVSFKKNRVILDAKAVYNVYSPRLRMGEFIPLRRPDTFMYFTVTMPACDREYKLPYNGIIKVGNKLLDNDIVLSLPFVSRRHFDIKCQEGNVRIEDVGSSNGIFLNGKRIEKGLMKNGDVLSIMSVNITLTHGSLVFDGVGKHITLKPIDPSGSQKKTNIEYPRELIYHKSPRLQEALPSQPIVLASPPSKGQKYEKSRGMGAMLAGTGAMAAASMMTGAFSPALMAARSASLLSPIVNVASASKMNKRRKEQLSEYEQQRLEKYGDYIEDQRVKIQDVADEQKRIRNNENKSPVDLFKTLYNLERELWERMPSDDDFLDVRVGMGYEDLCVPVTSRNPQQGFAMENDEVEDLVDQLIEETRIVDNIPLRLNLRKFPTIGLVGNRSNVINLVRNMVISLTANHSFEDVRLAIIYDQEEHEFWKYLKWLPHIWAPDGQGRMIAMNKEGAEELLNSLLETVEQRRQEAADADRNDAEPMHPHYVFIFASKSLVEKHLIMNSLFDENPNLGITSLFMFNDMYELPPKCNYIVDMSKDPFVCEKKKVNERKYFTPEPDVSDNDFNGFVRRMSAVELEGFATQSPLPKSITFLEGYGVETVEDLNVGMRWQMSDPYSSLAAPIGRLMGDKTFALDIHENAHGPHGLAAGTTGSGKSELLQTWILSMACSYHPHDVSFVIVDYKGGGMADILEPLPHVVGKITNISGDINRPIESLKSETLRREKIFAKYGVSNIYKYQKLHRQGKAEEILPHLVIVVDEFAELKKDQPEFIRNLVSVSQVGRSLGIHLVLATQKPGGVVDDNIKANSKFRLCLKVQDATDSREMLKTPDASRLRESGRAFVRVGEDELYMLFQSFWSGAPYYGAELDKHNSNQIKMVDLAGQRIDITEGNNKVKSDVDEITAIVRYIADYAETSGIVPVQGPWLDELPSQLPIDDILNEYQHKSKWLKIPVGKFDIPSLQLQGCQYIDLAEGGHLAVYGAPGTGKTTFLKTFITSAAINFTPQEVVFYCIDCGGWGLSVFESLPHVGGVALDCEEEKIMKLKLLIEEEMDRRKKLFVANGVSSLSSYRQDVSSDLPAVVLVIDNIAAMFELVPDIEQFMINLASQGATYGFYIVYTSNSTSGVRFKVVQNMKNAVTFEMTDKADYTMLVGRLAGTAVLNTRGRALIKGNPPIEFQTALSASGSTEKERNDNLKATITSINEGWTGYRPDPIPVMPETVTEELMQSRYSQLSMIPIGIDANTVRTAYIDLSKRYCFLVTGGMNSGKSKMLETIYSMISTKFDNDLYVFDSDRAILSKLKDSCVGYSAINQKDETHMIIDSLIGVLDDRMNDENNRKPIIILIDDLKQFVDEIDDDHCRMMERICRLAEGMSVMIFAAGRSDDITKYAQLEMMTSTFIKHQNGISLSGSPNQNMFFRNELKASVKNAETDKDFGMLYDDGNATIIKYVR